MIKKVTLIISVASLCLLSIMMNAVNPTEVGPFGILIFFGLSYLSLVGLVAYFLFILSRVYMIIARHIVGRKLIASLSFIKSTYYSAVISMGIVIVLGLQTVASLGLYQLLLVGLLVFIGCLYIAKRIS